MVGSCSAACGQTGPRCFSECCFWVPGGALCSSALTHPSFVYKSGGWRCVQGTQNLVAGVLDLQQRCCGRGPSSWWHQEATTCQGWAFPAIPCKPRRQTAGDSPAHPGSPGPPPEPITAPCSCSSLFSLKQGWKRGRIQCCSSSPALLECGRGREASHQPNS